MRLIDADALSKEVLGMRYTEEAPSVIFTPVGADIFNSGVEAANFAIHDAPTIDAALVVHARWDEDDGTCSACHHEACYDEWTEPKWDYDWDENLVQTGEETHIQFIFSPYCPNCGAKMDGDVNEKD